MFRPKNGKANKATKIKTREWHVIDLSKAPYMSFGGELPRVTPRGA